MPESDVFELDAEWWLPGTPDNRVVGHLTFRRGSRPRVTIQGVLDQTDAVINQPYGYEFVLGTTNTGQKISLQECTLRRHTMSPNGYSTSEVDADVAYIDVHFADAGSAQFDRLWVHFLNFEEWAGKRAFDVDLRENGRSMTVKYDPPSPIEMHPSDVIIRVTAKGPSLRQKRFTEISVSQQLLVGLDFGRPRPLKDFQDTLRHIQNFLSLMVYDPTYRLSIEGVTDANTVAYDDGEAFCPPVPILSQESFFPTHLESKHGAEMLCTLPTIENDLETYLDNWLSSGAAIEPVHNLYFSVVNNPKSYLELTFLCFTQALETYHRRRFGGKYQSDEEYHKGLYTAFLEVIPDGTDPDFRESLKRGKLKYANEFSLRRCLKEIADEASKVVQEGFLASNRDRASFVRRVSDTRNYLTHYDLDLVSKAADIDELVELTDKARILLEMCLLREIGFEPEQIRSMLMQHRVCRWRLGVR